MCSSILMHLVHLAAGVAAALATKAVDSTTMVPTDLVGHQMGMAALAGMAHLVVATVADPEVQVALVVLVVLEALADTVLQVVGTAGVEEAAEASAQVSNVKMALVGMTIASSNVPGISYVRSSSFTTTPFSRSFTGGNTLTHIECRLCKYQCSTRHHCLSSLLFSLYLIAKVCMYCCALRQV